jgi:hypothetical protein
MAATTDNDGTNSVSETTGQPQPRNQLHSSIASIGATQPAPLSRRR